MTLFTHPEGTWKTLIALTALSITFACILIVFESLFVGITFGWPLTPAVCRLGSGIWAGSCGVTCATIIMIVLCRRKEEFSDRGTIWFCAGVCCLTIVSDCALIVSESVCLINDTKSPLPVFLLSAGGVHGKSFDLRVPGPLWVDLTHPIFSVVCSISALALFYLLWKSSVLDEKEKEASKMAPLEQRHMIIIPNILQSHPSFVSVELN